MKILKGRFFAYSLGALLFVALASALELKFMHIGATTFSGKLLFLLFFNLNIFCLFLLIFAVGKGLYRLFVERRRRLLGHRFKTKVVAFFVVLTSIPAALLFLVASGLGTSYIERLFTPQFRDPIENSMKIAMKFYDMERSRTLQYAKMARSGFAPPTYYKVIRMAAISEESTAAERAAFEGREETEVVSGGGTDTVRAALPEDPAKPGSGIIVVESSIPPEITRNVEDIERAYADYIRLESWVFPLEMNYLLMLGFFTLLIVFAALWFSLRIAEWMTEPVRSLASATEAVAAGNLSVSIASESASKRPDEMGLLIGSFNRMVGELREGKDSLEKAYAESDRRRLTIENILENIQSGVISLDARGVVQTVNPAACRILSLRAEDVIGKYYTGIVSGIASEELSELIKGINIKTFRSVEREVWATVEGKRMLLKVLLTGLRDSSGKYLGLLVVLDDLTGVVKAQRAIAWQEVARRMAHEIKNPLTPIKLSAERALKKWINKDEDFGAALEHSAGTIIREVDSLRRLVDEFSRLGKMPRLNKAPTDLKAVMDEVAALYKGYRSLEIKISAPAVMPPVMLDSEQIKRVMINLFDNAIEAQGGEGVIGVRVEAAPEANRLLIEVADEGPGIKDEDKERLFEPYFSTKKNGTGLGLAIADRIIADHGGSISVRDNAPRGTVFAVELPLREEA